MTLSVVIPTLNAAAALPATLACVGAADDIVVADGGSTDGTVAVARRAGARVVTGPRGRGAQVCAGAAAATGTWLLFLHADTRMEDGWGACAAAFMAAPENAERAGYFRFALDDPAAAARRLERLVAWRNRRLALPYGDQGLLLSRAFHDALGGFRPMPLMEDVDMVRRIGGRRLVPLAAAAVTSAARYRREGYLLRPARNVLCLGLYFLGVPSHRLVALYGGGRRS